jgi:dsDNA-specific endonuclease/ATPase MutS2
MSKERPLSKLEGEGFMTLLEWMKRWLARDAQAGAAGRAQEQTAVEDEAEVDPYNPFPEGVRVEIADVIDLHTINPREVRKVVEEYLLEARRARFRAVRIIHGKGVGVQREMVRSILGRTPFVVDWTDAPPQSGGWGATIAHLTLEDD